ncbi:MAG: hypothetical protein IJ468_01390 [Lachnospiraceae bacterium]|nr:hypothetical protein [Lachnospiraceae bacterium]
MNWMETLQIDPVPMTCLLVFTSATGSVLMGLWQLIGLLLEKKGYHGIRFHFFRLLIPFFLVPVIYLLFSWLTTAKGGWYGILFLPTPPITRACEIFLIIWAIGAGLTFLYYLCVNYALMRKLRNRTAAVRWKRELFERVCEEMGIPAGRIQLYESFQISVPCAVGGIRRSVILPDREYTGKELRVIFVHELTHCRQWDVLMKRMVILIEILEWFNPFVWLLHRQVERWSEYACDYYSVQFMRDEAEYWHVIEKMAEEWSGLGGMLVQNLLENRAELVRRMERMVKRTKNNTKWVKQICLSLVAISVMCVFAVSSALAQGYTALYRETVVMIEEEPQVKEMQEFEAESVASGVLVEDGELLMNRAGTSGNFTWAINKLTLKRSSEIYLEAGETIFVAVGVDPSDSVVMAGIMDSDGALRYVTGTSGMSHDFAIDESGNYRVFVQNCSDVIITVNGMYVIH